MSDENSLLIDAELVPVPEAGWREIPVYCGHRWAEPDRKQLRAAMRTLYEDREFGYRLGKQARQDIVDRFTPKAVAAAIPRLA